MQAGCYVWEEVYSYMETSSQMCVVRFGFGFLVNSGESLITIKGKESCFLPTKSLHAIEKLLKHTITCCGTPTWQNNYFWAGRKGSIRILATFSYMHETKNLPLRVNTTLLLISSWCLNVALLWRVLIILGWFGNYPTTTSFLTTFTHQAYLAYSPILLWRVVWERNYACIPLVVRTGLVQHLPSHKAWFGSRQLASS